MMTTTYFESRRPPLSRFPLIPPLRHLRGGHTLLEPNTAVCYHIDFASTLTVECKCTGIGIPHR